MTATSRVTVNGDNLAHLSVMGSRTLCDRRVMWRPEKPSKLCPSCVAAREALCASQSAANALGASGQGSDAPEAESAP